MAQYGLGNFLYELEVNGGKANFKFVDPDDASNHAEVSVDQSAFPEGVTHPDSRQVAEIAYQQVAKQLNDARDERLKTEAADAEAARVDEEHRARSAAQDFFDNTQELGDSTPTGGQLDAPEEKKAPKHNENPQDSVPDDSAPAADSSDNSDNKDDSKSSKSKK